MGLFGSKRHQGSMCESTDLFNCGGRNEATHRCCKCGMKLCGKCVKVDRLGARQSYCSLCFIQYCL